MDRQQICAVAAQYGIVEQALDAIVDKVMVYFAGSTPKPAEVEAFIQGLPTWAKMGIEPATFDALKPQDRAAFDRTHSPKPPESRRPVTRSLSAAELAAHDEQAAREGWSRAEYTEKARALQQTPRPPQP